MFSSNKDCGSVHHEHLRHIGVITVQKVELIQYVMNNWYIVIQRPSWVPEKDC